MPSFRDIAGTILSPLGLLDKEMNVATRNILAVSVKNNSHWLDIGCGLKSFAPSFDHARYIGIGIELSGRSSDMKMPDKFFDGINIPLKNSSFDGLLCTQVHEHIDDIDLLLSGCDSA